MEVTVLNNLLDYILCFFFSKYGIFRFEAIEYEEAEVSTFF